MQAKKSIFIGKYYFLGTYILNKNENYILNTYLVGGVRNGGGLVW